VPLTAIAIIDLVPWRVIFIASSPGRWIALVFALAFIGSARVRGILHVSACKPACECRN
jgi:hypothetical protein